MAKAEIDAGICGFTTTVKTRGEGATMKVIIESDCEHIEKLAAALTGVDPFREITFRGDGPLTLELARLHCAHAACPVPTGILKAIEVEAGLALPKDVTITVTKDWQRPSGRSAPSAAVSREAGRAAAARRRESARGPGREGCRA